MMGYRVLWIVAGWLALAPCATARAEDKCAEWAVRDLYERGARAYQDGKYKEAIQLFKGAYACQPTAMFLFNMAQAQQQDQQLREALANFHEYLKKEDPNAPTRCEAERHINELQGQLAQAAQAGLSASLKRERAREARLHVAKWVIGAAGLAAVAAGAALWAVNGQPTCTLQPGQALCPERLATQPLGIALVAGGAALVGSAGVMFGLDYAANQKWERLTLMVKGAF